MSEFNFKEHIKKMAKIDKWLIPIFYKAVALDYLEHIKNKK